MDDQRAKGPPTEKSVYLFHTKICAVSRFISPYIQTAISKYHILCVLNIFFYYLQNNTFPIVNSPPSSPMPEIKNIKILTYLYCQGQENSVQRTLHMHMTCTSILFWK